MDYNIIVFSSCSHIFTNDSCILLAVATRMNYEAFDSFKTYRVESHM